MSAISRENGIRAINVIPPIAATLGVGLALGIRDITFVKEGCIVLANIGKEFKCIGNEFFEHIKKEKLLVAIIAVIAGVVVKERVSPALIRYAYPVQEQAQSQRVPDNQPQSWSILAVDGATITFTGVGIMTIMTIAIMVILKA